MTDQNDAAEGGDPLSSAPGEDAGSEDGLEVEPTVEDEAGDAPRHPKARERARLRFEALRDEDPEAPADVIGRRMMDQLRPQIENIEKMVGGQFRDAVTRNLPDLGWTTPRVPSISPINVRSPMVDVTGAIVAQREADDARHERLIEVMESVAEYQAASVLAQQATSNAIAEQLELARASEKRNEKTERFTRGMAWWALGVAIAALLFAVPAGVVAAGDLYLAWEALQPVKALPAP
ncbi:hypothetical protein OVA14_07145 [Agrococcus sp. SL85]|uniref:hypothetical protein n=1 Tax=Agrococcus sp. SL85 TaxID=2995141 RepID=UPI00226CA817|nr:hypothetical protein [Agrococcus sp. SL85]WAC65168.1 hypothetical protein OVA14_07145 [Agrococcus sp. SL85]